METRKHTVNHTRYKSLDKMGLDKRVLDIWDEGEDGIWVALHPGWINTNLEAHTLHEWTVKDLLASYRDHLSFCSCSGCESCFGTLADRVRMAAWNRKHYNLDENLEVIR